MRGVDPAGAVAAVLDRRLAVGVDRPLAMAFSGGGDSLALLIAAQAWARRRDRRLLVLTVDHGLQAASREWTSSCAAVAARLGVAFQALSWEGPKPASGLSAAARQARHSLLAQAAREAGARVLLMGHTADDLAEAAEMRREGSTTPSPREWAPSPAWPEGRGVFILRPMLGLRRDELRAWLGALGESWIEDPANADPRQARARARLRLAGAAPEHREAGPVEAADLALASRADAAGGLALLRNLLQEAPAEAARRLVAAACLCAAGGTRPPRGDRLASLVERLRGQEAVTATLAGARIEAGGDQVRFMREPGEAARGGLAELALPPGEPVVWDGRFEITANRPGLQVRRMAGLAARLPAQARAALLALPPGGRGGAPAILDVDGGFAAPDDVRIRALGHARLLAACGAVRGEA